jgi:hypothetical protein
MFSGWTAASWDTNQAASIRKHTIEVSSILKPWKARTNDLGWSQIAKSFTDDRKGATWPNSRRTSGFPEADAFSRNVDSAAQIRGWQLCGELTENSTSGQMAG